MRKFFYIVLIIINISLILACFNVAGWDYKIINSAVRVFDSGSDPYLVHNLNEYSSAPTGFLYLPLSIILFKVIGFLNQFITPTLNYYIFWFLALLGTFIAVRKTEGEGGDRIFLITLLMTGFVATWWNFFTGNVDLLHLFIISLVFYMIKKQKYYISAILIVLNSLIKIIPLVFGFIFIFLKLSKFNRARIVVFLVTLFILANLISFLVFPDLTKSYYSTLLGKSGSQYSPVSEGGGWANPSLVFLLKDISKNLPFNNNLSFIMFFAAFFIFISYSFINFIKNEKHDNIEIFSLGILCLMLILPRLKPYSFVWALLPIYFLSKKLSQKNKIMVVAIVSVLPLSYLFLKAANKFYGFTYWKVLDYGQGFSLLFYFIAFLIFEYLEKSENSNLEIK